MKFGIFIGSFEDFADPELVLELALKIEELGFDGVFLPDHLNYGNKPFFGETSPAFLDPWIMLAGIATKTSRIKLGSWITPLARRLPWQLARNLATLDHLSNGRVILGGGLGGPPTEYASYGTEYNPKVLAEKMDEALEIITGLWSEGSFSFKGKHFTIEDVELYPKPVQKPRIPIMMGGKWPSKKPIRRAAKWDGYMPISSSFPNNLTDEEVDELISFYRDLDPEGKILINNSGNIPVSEFVQGLQGKAVDWAMFSIIPMTGTLEDCINKLEQIASELDLPTDLL